LSAIGEWIRALVAHHKATYDPIAEPIPKV